MTKKISEVTDAMLDKKIRKISRVFMPSAKEYKEQFKIVQDAMTQEKAVDQYLMHDITRTVLNYFYQVEDFDKYGVVKNTADITKGLLIYGPHGVGKSFLMESLHRLMKYFAIKKNKAYMYFSSRTAPWLVEEYMKAAKPDKGQSTFVLEHYYKGQLYIDDLGLEDLAFNKKELLSDVLFHRHRNEAKTYITTNLTPSQIAERYGSHIGDRLPEMFNIIKWDGDSLRKE